MTENSSKGLTWGTFAAGVVSALLLTVIGCVKPIDARPSGSELSSRVSPSTEGGASRQRYVSQESAARNRAASLPSSRY